MSLTYIGQLVYDSVAEFNYDVKMFGDLQIYEPLGIDYFYINTEENAVTKISTEATDADGGHLLFKIDGNIEFNQMSANTVLKFKREGNDVDHMTLSMGDNGEATFVTTDAASTLEGGQVTWDLDCGFMKFIKNGNTSDFLKINLGENGDATLQTFDAAAKAAHFEIAADGNITLDAAEDIALEAAGGDITGDANNYSFTSSGSGKPLLTLESTNTTVDASSELKFIKDAANIEDGEYLGKISWHGDNDAGTPEEILYAQILARTIDVSDGTERGSLYFQVAEFDGNLNTGLSLVGTDTNGEIDASIGQGAASVTTVSGTLTMGSTAFVNNSGVIQVATQGTIDHDSLANFAANEHFTQANITTVGTIDTGVWNGTAIASEYLDADTAHLTTAQTFTGAKTFGTTTKLQFRDANAYINSPDANDLEIAATDITLDAAGTVTVEADDLVINSTNANDPLVNIINDANDSTSGRLRFLNRRGADGQDNDETGIIEFFSFDDGTPAGERYSRIIGTIHDATAGQESGKLTFQVASHDGEDVDGLVITGGDAEDVVDVIIGNKATSTTVIAGQLQVSSAIDLGATDTTIARSAAGKVTIEGANISTHSLTLKVLPSAFQINDDAGRPAFVEDDTPGTLGIRAHGTTDELYAWKEIPLGFKVTHVQVHASASTSSAVKVMSYNYQTGADDNIASTTADFNENKAITNIPALATQDLVIKCIPASGTTIIYGASVTIALI